MKDAKEGKGGKEGRGEVIHEDKGGSGEGWEEKGGRKEGRKEGRKGFADLSWTGVVVRSTVCRGGEREGGGGLFLPTPDS
jgi:hypothetical protein